MHEKRTAIRMAGAALNVAGGGYWIVCIVHVALEVERPPLLLLLLLLLDFASPILLLVLLMLLLLLLPLLLLGVAAGVK